MQVSMIYYLTTIVFVFEVGMLLGTLFLKAEYKLTVNVFHKL